MINFDAVDFSERHPEEVISFFWRSVYMVFHFHIMTFLWDLRFMFVSGSYPPFNNTTMLNSLGKNIVLA